MSARAYPMVGERLPVDPVRRRRVVHRFGPARALHLGDYLGPVGALRALAADPAVDLTVVIDADRSGAETPDAAAHLAAALVACGLGSVVFTTGTEAPIDLDAEPADLGTPPAIHDLREPRVLMGQAGADSRGVVQLLDSPLRIAAAVRGAQTDLNPMLGYDPQLRPGVANLAVILGALTGRTPIAALYGLHGSSQLKRAVTDALVAALAPVRDRYAELAADPVLLTRLVRLSR